MDRIILRSAAVRILFVALLVLAAIAGSAHAAPTNPPIGAPEASVSSALFTPTHHDYGVDWRASWVLTPEAAAEIADGGTRAIRFVMPLTESETLEPTFGVTPFTEGGNVAGVLVDRGGLEGRVVTAHVRQQLKGMRGVRLGAPVAAGHALQIIDGDLQSGLRLEVDAGRALERHVGYVVPPGVSRAAREEARRLTGYDGRVSGAAIYVRGDDVKNAGGFVCTIETPRARGQHGTIGIAVAFGAIVIALIVAVRKLRDAASSERADAILAAEVDALGTPGERSR